MRAPVSWIREHVDLPPEVSSETVADRLTALGLKLEALEHAGVDLQGPLVVGRVLDAVDEPQKNGKVIRWCQVDVGQANETGEPQGIVCGAHNFSVGDLVVVILPGGVLPGGFEISARKTYGHVSAGMICSTRELGLGDDHEGILVLPAGIGEPGDDAIDLLHLRDDVIEMEINPDRAYALSIRGVAREVALGLDLPYDDPAARDLPRPDGGAHPVEIEDAAGCPVFVTRVVSGIDPAAPTPSWMARRLHLAGMRPISVAVDVTNYVMLELGQPIHGYDADKLQGPIRVRRAQSGERLTTLDSVERQLSVEDLLICDDSGPIGLAGVMGGETTELSMTSSRVVIEAAHFDPVSIFRTQRRHKLPSEASKRFERGVDPVLPEAAADRVAELLVAHAGGRVEPGVTTVGTAPASSEIELDAGLPRRVTGMPIDDAVALGHLRAVGCTVAEPTDGSSRLRVTPPTWRPDLTDPFDLVEEVARLVGYDQVPSILPSAPAGRGLTEAQQLRRRVGRTLAGAGLAEVVSFPFVGQSAYDVLGLDAGDPRRSSLRVANPLSAEAPLLTTTLLPGLLEAGARNAGRGTADVALFEVAPVTLSGEGRAAPILPVDRRPSHEEWEALQAAVPAQPLHLAVLMSGELERPGWWGEGRVASWADAVDVVRRVAQAVGAVPTFARATEAPWHPGRCAEIRLGDDLLGHAGELHPQVCRRAGIAPRSVAAEIDLEVLLSHASPPQAPQFSSFPVAKVDVALVVDVDTSAAEVERSLRLGAGELLESVRLFDLYVGEQVGAGSKSLAFSLRLRAPDRTLTDDEVTLARDAAVDRAAADHGATLR